MERRWNEWIEAEEVVKDWRRPAAVLLRLAIPFGLSALEDEQTFSYILTFIRRTRPTHSSPKVLGFPTDLEAVSP